MRRKNVKARLLENTVKALRDQIQRLTDENRTLKEGLQEEKGQRAAELRRLESLNRKDIENARRQQDGENRVETERLRKQYDTEVKRLNKCLREAEQEAAVKYAEELSDMRGREKKFQAEIHRLREFEERWNQRELNAPKELHRAELSALVRFRKLNLLATEMGYLVQIPMSEGSGAVMVTHINPVRAKECQKAFETMSEAEDYLSERMGIDRRRIVDGFLSRMQSVVEGEKRKETDDRGTQEGPTAQNKV